MCLLPTLTCDPTGSRNGRLLHLHWDLQKLSENHIHTVARSRTVWSNFMIQLDGLGPHKTSWKISPFQASKKKIWSEDIVKNLWFLQKTEGTMTVMLNQWYISSLLYAFYAISFNQPKKSRFGHGSVRRTDGPKAWWGSESLKTKKVLVTWRALFKGYPPGN